MIGRPGSTLWLLGHEMRVGWRGLAAKSGRRRGLWMTLIVGLMIALLAGVPMGLLLRRVEIPASPIAIVIAAATMTAIFTLMLSQTLMAATEALYERGDLDLLFTSPLAPRKALTVRFLSISLGVFSTFAFFLVPLVIPIAILGSPQWLGAVVVLASLALGASGVGLVLAMGLFRVIGPRRTRTMAQVLGAVIGAGFFLASQSQLLLGRQRARSVWADLVQATLEGRLKPGPFVDWPLRAAWGEPLPLATMTAAGAGLFFLSNQWLGARFAADAAAAKGADVSRRARTATTTRFAAGAFAATLRKELRLLLRDPGLISQVLLRVLYLIPLAFILVRNAKSGSDFALAAGVAGLTFVAGQVAGSLSWITVSAEDAPDLLACAPTPVSTLRNAKLAAAMLPLAAILAIPLAALIVLAPIAGLAATAGCAAAGLTTGLINIWYQKPGKRADFRRRRGSSWYATLAEVIMGLVIATAAAMAVVGTAWALLPTVVAAILLLVLRRSDAQIAQALRAAA